MYNKNDVNVLYDERFPLSNMYGPAWIFANEMGPNPLWLTEYLSQLYDLKPGMRVLDLGCGKGITSVFLAREFGVQVFAADLWEGPDGKWEHALANNVQHLIVPVHADARELPFAKGFFDAVICVDAYIYFGAEDGYLDYLAGFVRPGGVIGMIIPGLVKDAGVPDYIAEFLGDELWTWKPLVWWKNLWERADSVDLIAADCMPDGCALWQRWEEALDAAGLHGLPHEIDMFRQDKGEYVGLLRLAAVKK